MDKGWQGYSKNSERMKCIKDIKNLLDVLLVDDRSSTIAKLGFNEINKSESLKDFVHKRIYELEVDLVCYDTSGFIVTDKSVENSNLVSYEIEDHFKIINHDNENMCLAN